MIQVVSVGLNDFIKNEQCKVRRSAVNVRLVQLHPTVGNSQSFESEPSIKLVRIACRQQHTTKSLQGRVGDDLFHQAPGQAFPAVRGRDKDIGEIGEGGFVCNDQAKPTCSRP